MSKSGHANATKDAEKVQAKPLPTLQGVGGGLALVELGRDMAGTLRVQNQAPQSPDLHLNAIQRQLLATQTGQTRGNRHLQRLLIQRQCACGGLVQGEGECTKCQQQRLKAQMKIDEETLRATNWSLQRAKDDTVNSIEGTETIQRDGESTQPGSLDTQLPPGSPYAALPDSLLQVLRRSFVEHTASNGFLANGFWAGATLRFEEALNRILTADIATIREIYDRASAIGGLWPFVYAIQNIWTGTSRGFNFHCNDVNGLKGLLRSSDRFCKDSSIGESQHSGSCWREMINGTPGLHICLDGGHAEIHIDMHQTVLGRGPGFQPAGLWSDAEVFPTLCIYNPLAVLEHLHDLGGGGGRSLFQRFDSQRDEIRNLRQEIDGLVDQSSRQVQTMRDDVGNAETRLNQIEPQVRGFAVNGFQGEGDALRSETLIREMGRVDEILRDVRNRLPTSEIELLPLGGF